jgi:RHS repeat-associated protein
VLIKPPSGPPTTQSFDANGNLTLQNAAGALSTFAWDGENRMVGYQNPAGAVGTLLYTADGLRKAADVQDGSAVETWRFVWDGQNVLRKESSAPGVGNDIIRTTDYPGYWGGLASLFDSIGGSQILAFDPQGNVRLVLQGGSVAGTGAYTGFGEVLSDPGISFAYVGLFGYQWDNPFYYVRARYYDPVTGKWFGRDPIGPWSGDSRLYGYGANNPVAFADPAGLAPCCYWVDILEPMPDAYLALTCRCQPCFDAVSRQCGWVSAELFCDVFDDGDCRAVAKKFGVDPAYVCAAAMTERSWEYVGLKGWGEWALNVAKNALLSDPVHAYGPLEIHGATAWNVLNCLFDHFPSVYYQLNAPTAKGQLKGWLQGSANSYNLLAAWLYLNQNGYDQTCTRRSGLSLDDFNREYNRHNPTWRDRWKCAVGSLKNKKCDP